MVLHDEEKTLCIVYIFPKENETPILSNEENDDFSKNIIISKSMYAGKKDEEYLTDILEDFLFNSLV